MDARQGALLFASRGFRVFRVVPNGKVPYRDGINEATTDPATINRWFDERPELNYGIPTEGRALIDIDPRKDPDGWIADYAELYPLPPTLTVITPSGGRHIWFDGFEAGQRRLKGSTCIDVRGRGGYVVGPGSQMHGKRWVLSVDAPPAPIPPAIRERMSTPGEKSPDSTTPVAELDTPPALAYGLDFVMRAHGAAKGERNSTLHMLACRLKDKGLSRESTHSLLIDHWCPKCDPPYEDFAEIERSVASAYDNGQKPPGADAPEHHFQDVSQDPDLVAWDGEHVRRLASPGNIAQEARAGGQGLLERLGDIDLAKLVQRQSAALVKGILHSCDQAVLYGESRAGKSFIGLDLAWHIALGKPWHGHRVNKAPVLYIALEGVDGFRKRMLAIGAHHGDPGLWFARHTLHPSLVRDEKLGGAGMTVIIQACKQLAAECGQPVGLIIIDTFARATAGDSENDTDAVMNFVEKRAGALARGLGAAVLTIAHTNRAGDLRGSLHLRNAMDVVLKAERTSDGEHRALIGEKIKDGAEITLFHFTLSTVDLATDADGDPVDSCVIETIATPPDAVRKATGPQKRLIEAYNAVRADLQKDDVPLADVRDRFDTLYPTGERNPEKAKNMKKAAWNRAKKELPPGFALKSFGGVEYLGKTGRTDPEDEFTRLED